MNQEFKIPRGMQVGLSPSHIVLDGDPAPGSLQKGGQYPPLPGIFGSCMLWPNGCMDHKMPVGREVGLSPGYIVLHGDICTPSPLKGAQKPHFLARVYCGQTAEWIKMTLGTEVGLISGHIVLDGDLTPPRKRGTAAPHFSAHVCYGQTVVYLSN